jgi:membrane-bound lytic murein transglycosylase C
MKQAFMSALSVAALFVSIDLNSSTDFEAFKNQFSQYAQANEESYKNYKSDVRKKLARFKAEISGVWGYADVTSGTRLVVYSKDKNEKVVIDYEKDEIVYSSITPANINKAEILLKNTLNSPITALQSGMSMSSNQLIHYANNSQLTVADSLGIQRDDLNNFITSLAKSSVPVEENEQIKKNLAELEKLKQKVEHKLSQLPKEEQQGEYAYIQEIIAESSQTQKHQSKLQAAPESKSTARAITVNSSRWSRTKPYRQYVEVQAQKYKLPQSLIFAIMETESSFNPLAQSPIPAFGLMQVVPTSAGIDVNHFLNKQKIPPTETMLFEPKQNVEFGATYMNILLNRYFKGVTDQTNRLYVSIAAYNTGPGNVAYIFNNKRSKKLKPAYLRINQLTPQQVYEQIINHAHQETRGYIKKVTKAKQYYEQFI